MSKITELKTEAVLQRQSLDNMIEGLNKAYIEGKLKSVALVYYDADNTPFTWITRSMEIANLAYATKLLDRHLNDLLEMTGDDT